MCDKHAVERSISDLNSLRAEIVRQMLCQPDGMCFVVKVGVGLGLADTLAHLVSLIAFLRAMVAAESTGKDFDQLAKTIFDEERALTSSMMCSVGNVDMNKVNEFLSAMGESPVSTTSPFGTNPTGRCEN